MVAKKKKVYGKRTEYEEYLKRDKERARAYRKRTNKGKVQ